LATDSRRERRSASASAVDVDASDDDEEEDAETRRLDGARCEVYRAGLDTDDDRRAPRRYDERGVYTAARDDTTLAMVRSRRTARVEWITSSSQAEVRAPKINLMNESVEKGAVLPVW
jgi:hypothetical protein